MTLFVLSKPLLYNISKPTCFRQQQKASISRIMAAYLKEHGPDEKKRIIRKKWKQEDSERLLKLVDQYGPKWKSFESEFPGRAASCIKSHYETRTGNSQLILTAEEKEILTREIESMQGDDVDWKMLQKSLLPSIRSITAIKKYYYGLNVKRYYERWTEDEVNQLGILVEKYGTKSWDKVVKEMKGRSSIQCQAKWFYESSIRNKEEFSLKEDEQIIKYVNLYGEKSFGKIKKEMKSRRTIAQLKSRFEHYLKPNLDNNSRIKHSV